MRDHNPFLIEDFNGLFKRGGKDSVPPDHFSDCNNIKFAESSFSTRDGIGPYAVTWKNVIRLYAFNQSLLILDINGNIYHSDRGANTFIPILSISGMTDFGFVKFNNRAYLTPIVGSNDFIYVYTYGDAAGARKAAGFPPSSAPSVTVGSAGNVEQGVHVFAVIYETDTGFLTQLSPGTSITLPDGTTSVIISLPTGPSHTAKRHVVATKAIDIALFTGDLTGYQFFFVPDGTSENNTDTSININFYDAELLEDASYLQDLYSEIPNQLGLNSYHNRLVGWASGRGNGGEHISEIIVSNVGDPESINMVDGLISLVRDGKPIEYCQEQRDILYVFKSTKTFAATDNGDVPSSWPLITIDQGIGSVLHGVGTVMDSGGVNIDYLIVGDFTGLLVFNGTYQQPELTWKIRDAWPNVDRSTFETLQVVVDSQSHFIYVVKPDGTMLVGDYNNGLDPKAIKWTPWTFDVKVTSLVILEESDRVRLIIGSKESI